MTTSMTAPGTIPANLVVFGNDLRMKLCEMTKFNIFADDNGKRVISTLRDITCVALVVLSKSEGLLKVDLNKPDILDNTCYFFRISREMLIVLQSANRADRKSWDALLLEFAIETVENFHYFKISIPIDKKYLAAWHQCPEEKKAAWMQQHSFHEVFPLPPPFKTIEAVKSGSYEHEQELIIYYDSSKTIISPMYAVIDLLGCDKDSHQLTTGILLDKLHNSIKISTSEDQPKLYKVRFDTKIRDELLCHIKEHDAWDDKLLNFTKDVPLREVLILILGELWGKPSPGCEFTFKVN